MQRLCFKWIQIVKVIPSNWKNYLKHSETYSQNYILLDHHLVKSNSLFNTEKLESRKVYYIINSSRNNKPTSQKYFEKKFDSKELDWRAIYILPRKVTTNTYLRSFQYKILNNILYLNEKFFIFGVSRTSSCSFCNSFDENITHPFCGCTITQCLWKKLQLKLKDDITLLPQGVVWPHVAPAYFGKLLCFWSFLLVRHYHTKNCLYMLWGKLPANLLQSSLLKRVWSDHLLPLDLLVSFCIFEILF